MDKDTEGFRKQGGGAAEVTAGSTECRIKNGSSVEIDL